MASQSVSSTSVVSTTISASPPQQTLHDYISQNGPLSILHAIQAFFRILQYLNLFHSNNRALNTFSAKDFIIQLTRDLRHVNLQINPPGPLFTNMGSNTTIIERHRNHDTVPYVSPEWLNNPNPYNLYHSNIWNLGVLFYSIVSGTFPFRSESPIEMKRLVLEANVVFPENSVIPDNIKSLIRSMLNRDGNARPTISQLLANEIFRDFTIAIIPASVSRTVSAAPTPASGPASPTATSSVSVVSTPTAPRIPSRIPSRIESYERMVPASSNPDPEPIPIIESYKERKRKHALRLAEADTLPEHVVPDDSHKKPKVSSN